MFFFDNVVIQNGNEDSKQDGKENEPTRKESVKTTNLQSVKSAFDIFLFDDTGEIDFLVEKSQISNAFEYTYKLVDGSLPNRYFRVTFSPHLLYLSSIFVIFFSRIIAMVVS